MRNNQGAITLEWLMSISEAPLHADARQPRWRKVGFAHILAGLSPTFPSEMQKAPPPFGSGATGARIAQVRNSLSGRSRLTAPFPASLHIGVEAVAEPVQGIDNSLFHAVHDLDRGIAFGDVFPKL